jgi:ribA/ribD-fused uncharacterized protein
MPMPAPDDLLLDPTKLIDWFDDFLDDEEWTNPFAFLSNFHEGTSIEHSPAIDRLIYEPIRPGVRPVLSWPTGEHAFAALKASRVEDFNAVANADDPGEAKMLGRLLDLRPDWEEVKHAVMAAVVASKFARGTELADRLVATGDARLVEGTYWGDEIWGVDLHDPERPGQNWLGAILSAWRAVLSGA